MTIIAYRDGIMASDSCISSKGFLIVGESKIVRLKSGAIVGCSGDQDARELIKLINHVYCVEDMPFPAALKDCVRSIEALIVFPLGDAWVAACGIEPEVCPADPGGLGYAAIGSGYEVAYGALAMGATAIEACEIACRFVSDCRPPIYSLNMANYPMEEANGA